MKISRNFFSKSFLVRNFALFPESFHIMAWM